MTSRLCTIRLTVAVLMSWVGRAPNRVKSFVDQVPFEDFALV
jgi:hypothetical protein